MSKVEQSVVMSAKAAEPVGRYPHARQVGSLLFLSGVGPREPGQSKIPGVELDAAGNIVSYDIETQCHSVFRNVRAVLEEAGASWEQLVDVTVFLTNMKADFSTYNRIWAEYFPGLAPCRTTLEVGALPTPIAIELKCIAVVEATAGGRAQGVEATAGGRAQGVEATAGGRAQGVEATAGGRAQGEA